MDSAGEYSELTPWVAGKNKHSNLNMEIEEEKLREINRVGKDNLDYYALTFNHKLPVCSSSGNWERKAQDEGDGG